MPDNNNTGALDQSSNFLVQTDFNQWSTQDLADYFKSRMGDLGQDYSEMMLKHNIDGKVAHRLKDNDLKDMGVTSVGDRLRIMQEFEKIERIQQQKNREKVIWQGKEVLYFTWWDQCLKTCCGCCPDDPDIYTLTGAHLTIKHTDPYRCGPIRCCFGHKYEIDNIDLSNVTDADVKGVPPTCCQQVCCCGKPQEHIYLKTNIDAKEKIMKLEKEVGANVSRKILNQVEIMQRMERS